PAPGLSARDRQDINRGGREVSTSGGPTGRKLAERQRGQEVGEGISVISLGISAGIVKLHVNIPCEVKWAIDVA
ncbi:MAG: hypothetical protein ACKPKO_43280, partial [Candidatus Fonsibacter sp.]